MAYPAIVYDPGAGPISLRFFLPPTGKPDSGDGSGDELQPLRADSFTLSGLKQSVLWRQDTFRSLHMELVPFSDLPAWRQFMTFAQTGAQFHYHQDADSDAYEIFELDDNQGSTSTSSTQGWAPKRVVRGLASFDINLRKVGAGTGEIVP
jgi:hypothetical protein